MFMLSAAARYCAAGNDNVVFYSHWSAVKYKRRLTEVKQVAHGT